MTLQHFDTLILTSFFLFFLFFTLKILQLNTLSLSNEIIMEYSINLNLYNNIYKNKSGQLNIIRSILQIPELTPNKIIYFNSS